ncbi:transposase [Streptomyces sp. NBC_01724]|uniref:transposase n=1 Tax=unclassified Streptomyces TaxID=2593676 RepID=UPI002E2F653C|nr:transposase [Streptomyces sp. NBC_01724]WTE57350.1 transposase [Streptomyces sp. NBC_01617]WTE64778.1 transposase [Streptomyces sp. NBC_01617]WTI84867.1 transposase [Streptomyces sp. NBC_00724]WTI92059.1 transposase [Streptomyces sp. NBC_00724]
MTHRLPCPPAPGPLEAYAARFDDLFSTLAQRRGFREYPAGLLLPRDRNKTLTCLAGTEPVVGAQHPAVQRLQFFLSESTWDHERVNARRVELLLADPATAPHPGGVLVIDDSGDRKDGTRTRRFADARVNDGRTAGVGLLVVGLLGVGLLSGAISLRSSRAMNGSWRSPHTDGLLLTPASQPVGHRWQPLTPLVHQRAKGTSSILDTA